MLRRRRRRSQRRRRMGGTTAAAEEEEEEEEQQLWMNRIDRPRTATDAAEVAGEAKERRWTRGWASTVTASTGLANRDPVSSGGDGVQPAQFFTPTVPGGEEKPDDPVCGFGRRIGGGTVPHRGPAQRRMNGVTTATVRMMNEWMEGCDEEKSDQRR